MILVRIYDSANLRYAIHADSRARSRVWSTNASAGTEDSIKIVARESESEISSQMCRWSFSSCNKDPTNTGNQLVDPEASKKAAVLPMAGGLTDVIHLPPVDTFQLAIPLAKTIPLLGSAVEDCLQTALRIIQIKDVRQPLCSD